MHLFYTDNLNYLRTVRFWMSLVVGLLFIMRPLFDVWRTGVHMHYSPMMLLSIPLATSDFTPFAPIFCAIPYATSFCDDYRSGYLKAIVIRIGVRRYSIMRTISTALSGAFVMMLIFTVMIMVCNYGAGVADTAERVDFLNNTVWARTDIVLPYGGLFTYLGRILLAFLFGSIWALVSLGLSTRFLNRYVALVAPFVLYQALWVIMANSPYNPLYLLRADDARIPSLLFVCLYMFLWIIIWGAVAYLGIKERCKNV